MHAFINNVKYIHVHISHIILLSFQIYSSPIDGKEEEKVDALFVPKSTSVDYYKEMVSPFVRIPILE